MNGYVKWPYKNGGRIGSTYSYEKKMHFVIHEGGRCEDFLIINRCRYGLKTYK
jgi:hypothetical protein